MKKLFCALVAATPIFCFGQITISESDFGNAGDTIRVSSTTANIDLSQTGTDITWDFSFLTAESQTLKEFKPMDNLPLLVNLNFGTFASPEYKASYHMLSDALPLDMVNNILPITLDEINLFSKLTSDKLTACGYSVAFNGQVIPVTSDTIETYYELPLNYGNVYTSVGYTQLDLNPIQDIQWSQYRQRSSNVDGWGSITTPFGTFDCIRMKHIIQETDSLYLAQIGTWQGIDLPEQIIYEWWGNGQKLPLLKVTTTVINGNETISGIEYRDNYNTNLASLVEETQNNVSIYPNPTDDYFSVNGLTSSQSFQIFDSKGTLQLTGTVSNENSKVLVEDLKQGSYILRLKNGAKFSFIKK